MSTPTDTTHGEDRQPCKRRGFIFQSSEIYGGLNGAWDYGPLGVELSASEELLVARHGARAR